MFGKSICDNLFDYGIEIEYVCEKLCVCMMCYVVICEGFNDLMLFEEDEDDLLDKVWGFELMLCLLCQVIVKEDLDLVVEILKYLINYVKENY